MPNLTSLIQVIPRDIDETPEDIFAAAPGLIFTDDLRNQHGDPGATIVYKSSRFGSIELNTADPESENERKLFGHYLWNAGVKMAELISHADVDCEDTKWSVRGRTVLELGAGVGLGGIVATLAGAKEVVLSDYPAPVVLANIKANAKKAIPVEIEPAYRVEGHEWGVLSSEFAQTYRHHFDRILAADCFWMSSQHSNLIASMLHFLAPNGNGRICAIAAFHTGRAKVVSFFDEAVESGLEIEEIYEENADSVKREWLKERDGGFEDHNERKKWLAIAILKRRP